jgi:threonine synthase
MLTAAERHALPWHLTCVECSAQYPALEVRYRCSCGGTLDVVHDLSRPVPDFATIDQRRMSRRPIDKSGVWRFREWVLPLPDACFVTKPEGNTNTYCSEAISRYAGLDWLVLKHEGENPTGSFKDRGMVAGVSVARALGMKSVACASTGNTSASMASYAAQAGMKAFVFIPNSGVALGKLAQATAYGAVTLKIAGDFDAAMKLVQRVCEDEGIYLLNSVNPFRIEGQKAIGFELLEDLGWQVPDWVVLPGGNLGNSSALAKGLGELFDRGMIDRLPRIAVIQARGANPLARVWPHAEVLTPVKADTIATAIKIGDPVSWRKCVRGLHRTQGIAIDVSDDDIMDAKAVVDAAGIGAEPASCATVAGIRALVQAGVIAPDAKVCGILTGHVLKDPDTVVGYHARHLANIDARRANPPVECDGTLVDVQRIIRDAGVA